MSLFALNLLIAVGWGAVSGSFAAIDLLLGYAGGFVALWLTRPLFGPSPYFRRTFGAIGLVVFFLYELVRSSIAVVWDVVTPEIHSRPRMVRMPLDCTDETQIMLTANVISLTPGTLTVDVSPDQRELVIHAMFAEDPDEVVHDLKRGLERRVMEALR
ncbi:Na+/H+ antiporter subunit E [Thiohalocapsa sp.]|uniref:Na+/H+ antiporter subunit E n=1 Tax=Thiohalocapsa sp. TaxID=2497641 RepID=UPI0025D57B83|nr:Na+/H+ antiporter subunit E [Thiohalocapsa sp.]